jgi:predicted nucleic acid-binding protein
LKPELIYLDSSAIVKLIVLEQETSALLSFLGDHPERASSVLARVEVLRALRRAGASASERRRAADVLARIALLHVDDDILESAAELEAADLRSLDAIHIATALSIQSELTGIVTYGERFSAAARRAGLSVFAPR